jgi:hypothetical protein
MPALTHADRRLLWGAAAVFMALVIVIGATGSNDQAASTPSVYSSESGGALAAWLLLRDLHYDVHIREQSPLGIESLPAGALLILAEPSEAPTPAERKSLRSFVSKGGRVLFCGAAVSEFFPRAKTLPSLAVRAWQEFPATLPGSITRNADRITIRPDTYWIEPNTSQIPLYGNNGSSVVVSWRIGDGEVLWWASATPLTNAGITKTGNLNLFLNSVAGSSADSSAPVYWDEYFHGERPTLASYISKTPVVWAAVQILIMTAALLFTFSRRSGPIVKLAGVSRLSPLEFVDTMGALYQHARACAVPVDVAYRNVRLELTRRLGLPTSISDADLAQAASARLGLDGAALAQALRETAGVRFYGDGKLSSREALAMVQSLEVFLEPTKHFPQDTIQWRITNSG